MVLKADWLLNTRQNAGTPPAGVLQRFQFPALGTNCEVQCICESERQFSEFRRAAIDWVTTFEAKYTRFRDDSLVGRINLEAGRGWVEIDDDASRMFDLAGQISSMTGGALDASSLPLIRLWNYKAEHPEIPDDRAIALAVSLTGWTKVQREPNRIRLPEHGMGIDLGGFGKEYAVDAVAEVALSLGVSNVLVDFGRDIRAIGRPIDAPAWRVGIEDPRKPGTWWCSIAASGSGIATSGDYIRGFTINGKRYGHIIDPRTGWPVANETLAATVIASSCLEAGVLSTTAFMSGPAGGLRLIEDSFGAEGCILTRSSLAQSRGFHTYRADQ